jgi:hypothetical protein
MDGLPFASNATGKVGAGVTYPFYCQTPFDNTFGDGSGVSLAGLRTYLMMDFSPSGPATDVYTGPTYPGSSVAPLPSKYGPSSAHPAVAIVTMGDGSVMAMNKRCDAANLWFLITKNGNDPFNIP